MASGKRAAILAARIAALIARYEAIATEVSK